MPRFTIDAHSAPIICAAGELPGVASPGVMAELARLGNGMENPAPFSRARIEPADMAGRGGIRAVATAAATYHEVLVNARGMVE